MELDRDHHAADFGARLRAVVVGHGVAGVERDLIDDAARKIRSEDFVRSRIALARQRAPPAACELLELLLQQDPAQRLTATQALRHRFITDSYLSSGQSGSLPPRRYALDEETVDRMRRFAGAPGLRRLAMLVEAHLLGPQDDDAIKQQVCTFRSIDERGMGVLTAADIAVALRDQGHNVPADLEEICLRLDSTPLELEPRGRVPRVQPIDRCSDASVSDSLKRRLYQRRRIRGCYDGASALLRPPALPRGLPHSRCRWGRLHHATRPGGGDEREPAKEGGGSCAPRIWGTRRRRQHRLSLILRDDAAQR